MIGVKEARFDFDPVRFARERTLRGIRGMSAKG